MSDLSPLSSKILGLAISPKKKLQNLYARGRNHFERRVSTQRYYLNSIDSLDGVALPVRLQGDNSFPSYESRDHAYQTEQKKSTLDMEFEVDEHGYTRVKTEDNADRMYMINTHASSYVYSYPETADIELIYPSPSEIDLDKPLPGVLNQAQSAWVQSPENGVEGWRAKLEYRMRQAVIKSSGQPNTSRHSDRNQWEGDLMIDQILRQIILHLNDGCLFIFRKLTIPTGPASCSHPLCRYKSPGHIRSHTKCVAIEKLVSNFMLERADVKIANGEIPIYTRELANFTAYHRGLIQMWFCVTCLEDLWNRYSDTDPTVLSPKSSPVVKSFSTFTTVNGHHAAMSLENNAPVTQSSGNSFRMRHPSVPLKPVVQTASSCVPRKRAPESTGSPERRHNPRVRLFASEQLTEEFEAPPTMGLDGTTDMVLTENGRTQTYVVDDSSDEDSDIEDEGNIQPDIDEPDCVDLRTSQEDGLEPIEVLDAQYRFRPEAEFIDSRPETFQRGSSGFRTIKMEKHNNKNEHWDVHADPFVAIKATTHMIPSYGALEATSENPFFDPPLLLRKQQRTGKGRSSKPSNIAEIEAVARRQGINEDYFHEELVPISPVRHAYDDLEDFEEKSISVTRFYPKPQGRSRLSLQIYEPSPFVTKPEHALSAGVKRKQPHDTRSVSQPYIRTVPRKLDFAQPEPEQNLNLAPLPTNLITPSPSPRKRTRYGAAGSTKFSSPDYFRSAVLDLSPTKRAAPKRRRLNETKFSLTIPQLWCICRGPDDGRDMVSCSMLECHVGWLHEDCLEKEERPVRGCKTWICPVCRGNLDSEEDKGPRRETMGECKEFVTRMMAVGGEDPYGMASDGPIPWVASCDEDEWDEDEEYEEEYDAEEPEYDQGDWEASNSVVVNKEEPEEERDETGDPAYMAVMTQFAAVENVFCAPHERKAIVSARG